MVSLDQCLLGQKSSWTNAPWTKWSLDNCPLDKCINTQYTLVSTPLRINNQYGEERGGQWARIPFPKKISVMGTIGGFHYIFPLWEDIMKPNKIQILSLN